MIDEPVEIVLMNEYGGQTLWDDEGGMDPDKLALSDDLRADLEAFADRWDANVPAEVYDDRWDGVPVMMQLVDLKYALRRKLNPAARRRAEIEDAEMRVLGEQLRVRLQDELGDGYRVTYAHG